MSLKEYINTVRSEPLLLLMGLSVLALAVMGTSVSHVSSSVFAILVLTSFIVVKDWLKIFTSLSFLEKVFLASFVLYTLSGVFSYYNADDVKEYFKLFERYIRFLLIVPVYFLLIRNKVSLLNFLYAGSIISGPFLVAIAISQYIQNPDIPSRGDYHHIIFGQLAMLNVGIMLSMLLSINMQRKYQLLISLSMACGIVTAVMSQARGVWLVFPVYVLFAIVFAVKDKRFSVKSVIAALVAILLITVFTPVGEVLHKRTETAVNEITNFYTTNKYATSVGGRLAMWDISIDVWKKYPFFGTGPGDVDDEILALQKQGVYAGMDLHNSVHNIYLQALVGSGIIGLLSLLLAVIFVPLRIFISRYPHNREGQLAGLVTIVSFAIFGFSESWILRLPSISIFLVFSVVIVSHIYITTSREEYI